MTPRKSLNRRSFMSRIVGGAIGGGALGVVSGHGAMATDNDPSDPASPPTNRPYTGISDRDSSDPANYGSTNPPTRNGRPYTGFSDHDTGDPAGYGSTMPSTQNGRPYTGITDRDPSDPRDHGRGATGGNPPGPNGRPYTGITDRDPSDPARYGRSPTGSNPSGGPSGPTSGWSGTWSSTEGDMVLRQNGASVTGTYARSGGRIEGTLQGGELVGYWMQDSSASRCPTPRNGTYFWGRIRWRLTGGTRMDGLWSYCDGEPGSSWTGNKTGN